MFAKRLITGLLAALIVSGLFTFWLSKKFSKPVSAAPAAKLEYVAAAKNLDAGDVLNTASLKMVEWSASSPLDGAVTKPETLTGRVLLYPISAGEPVLERQLSSANGGFGLTAKIPEGMRAISLKSDEVVGVAGFMLPGTHVDVLVTYHIGTNPNPVTATVLQDVQILAAGQKTTPDPDGKATTADVVTLLVNPDDAEKAVLACAQGTVHFVLRNGADHEHVSDKPTELNNMNFDASKVPPGGHKLTIAPVAKPYTVEVINGNNKSTESFQ
jgi:pilus assembly protein CpaB